VKIAAMKMLEARPALWTTQIDDAVLRGISDKQEKVAIAAFELLMQRDTSVLLRVIDKQFTICLPATKVRILQRSLQAFPAQSVEWHITSLNDDAKPVRAAARGINPNGKCQ